MRTNRWSRWWGVAGLTMAVAATAATPSPAPATAPPPTATGAAAAAVTAAPPTTTTTPVAPPAAAATPSRATPAAPSQAAPPATAPASPTSAGPTTRATYRAALDRVATDYNRKRASCRPMKGNERTVCIAEAKADAKRAEAAAEAAYRNTPRARLDARVAAANADYAVAKARCNAKSGTERRSCLRSAKDKQAETITAAMRAPT